MNKDDEIYAQLFKNTDNAKGMTAADVLALQASVFLTRKQMENTFIVRTVIAIAARLSVIASVWLFLFRHDLWYGILIFSVLALIFGGVADRGIPINKDK